MPLVGIINAGYVEDVIVSKDGGQAVIPPAAVAAFRERYVSLAELAGAIRKGYRVIKRELAAKGVFARAWLHARPAGARRAPCGRRCP